MSRTYLSWLRRAMSHVRLAISVPCHAVSYFLSSSPCHAMPCLCFCRSVPCHAVPAGGRLCQRRLGPCLESVLGSSVSSRVMRVSVSFRAGQFSSEGRSVSCRVIRGGCKFEPCHAMSYHLCAWPFPCLALIYAGSLVRVVSCDFHSVLRAIMFWSHPWYRIAAQHYIRRAFYYWIIVYCVICSWVAPLALLT